MLKKFVFTLLIMVIATPCMAKPKSKTKTTPTPPPVEETAVTEKPVEEGMDPVNMMKTWKFWQVWLCLLILSYVNIYISSFYKVLVVVYLNVVLWSDVYFRRSFLGDGRLCFFHL